MSRDAGPALPPPLPGYVGTARWLSIGVALLIVWGSLYPFEFSLPTPPQLKLRLAHAASHFMSRSDLVANVLLYIPLGGVLQLALLRPRRMRAFVAAGVAGSLLSLTMELCQLATPHRVTSVFDWLLNSTGAVLGAGAAACYLLCGSRWRFPSLLTPRPALVPLAMIALWLAADAIPHAAVTWTFALASWWVLMECARRIWRLGWAMGAVAGLAGLSAYLRRWFAPELPHAADLLAPLLVLITALGMRAWTGRSRALATAAICIAALYSQGFSPLVADAPLSDFHWIPFSGSLLSSREYRPLLEHLFLHAGLLWSLTLGLRRLEWAFALTFALTLAIELSQMWMPQRRAEITDPLLVLALALVFWLARRHQEYAFGAPPCIQAAAPREFQR